MLVLPFCIGPRVRTLEVKSAQPPGDPPERKMIQMIQMIQMIVLSRLFHFGSSVLHRALRDVDVTVKVAFLEEYVHMAGWMNE